MVIRRIAGDAASSLKLLLLLVIIVAVAAAAIAAGHVWIRIARAVGVVGNAAGRSIASVQAIQLHELQEISVAPDLVSNIRKTTLLVDRLFHGGRVVLCRRCHSRGRRTSRSSWTSCSCCSRCRSRLEHHSTHIIGRSTRIMK